MTPDYQTLMRPVLACAAAGETRIGDAVEQIAEKLGLTPDERPQLLPSGKQAMLPTAYTGRSNWSRPAWLKAPAAATSASPAAAKPRGYRGDDQQRLKAKVNEVDGATATTPARVSAPMHPPPASE